MVDSADRERLDEAGDELHRALSETELEGAPVLILANKQDLPGHMTMQEVVQALDLHSLRNRPWCE